MRVFVRLMIGIGLIASLAACAGSRAPAPDVASRPWDDGNLEVLFVGNSYSFGVPNAFKKVARKNGKRVRVAQVTRGGWTLEQHVDDGAAVRKIRERKWDVVVLQEQSRIPSMPTQRKRRMFPNVRALAAEARNCGAVPVLYQTWGRRDGDEYRKGDDFHAMTGRLREGYREAGDNAGNLPVVPVGDAWEREALSGGVEHLFQEDGSHPTKDGDALTAETFFEFLYSN